MVIAVRNWEFWPQRSVEYSTATRFKHLQFGAQGYPPGSESYPVLPEHVPSQTKPFGSLILDTMIADAPYSGYATLKEAVRLLNPSKSHFEWFWISIPAEPPYWSPTEPTGLDWERPEWWSCWNLDVSPSNSTVNELHRSLKYLEVTNSSNTPDWFDTKGVKVDGLSLTRKSPPIKRPKKPVYFQPRLKRVAVPVKPEPVELRIKPPLPFKGEGVTPFKLRLDRWAAAKLRRENRLNRVNSERYARKLAQYEVIRKINASRISNYDKAYKKAHALYEVRLVKYLEAVKKSKDLTYSRSPAIKGDIPKDNPYGRIKMTLLAPAVISKMIGWRKWVDSYIQYSPIFQEHYQDVLAFYQSSVLSSESTASELAQYGEDVRNLIVGIINPHLEEYDAKLRRKIHQKLKNQTVHIGNIIAERKQTMDLVQSSVKRILDLIKLKKNIFKAAASYAKNPKQIASDVLAFKFGVEPLMNDIQKFAQYLDKDSDNHVVVVRANTGSKHAIPVKVSTSQLTFEGFVEISYTVKCVVDNPALRTLSEFGMVNPLEILWEVTPWSFVVDWFLPVGDWISNKTSDLGLTFKTGTRKIKLVGSFTTNVLPQSGSAAPPMTGVVDESNVISFVGEVIDRSVLTDIPDLPPVKFKNPLSWSHGIESVALAVQRLKIRRP